jgi:NAD-dependent SIR2 family protein deacetylase
VDSYDILKHLKNNGYAKEAQEAGVSVGFLAVVIEANLDEFISAMLDHASECGELACRSCLNGDYYSYQDAPRDKEGNPVCPDCGDLLRSSHCWFCGEQINSPREAEVRGGYTCCPECAQKKGVAKNAQP